MYLDFDYNFALRRQAELIRWAEEQRKVQLAKSIITPKGSFWQIPFRQPTERSPGPSRMKNGRAPGLMDQ